MAKSLLKIKARKMRIGGESIIVIANQLQIAKSTISLWCRDIELSEKQITNLLERKNNGLKRAQILGALVNKKRKLELIDNMNLAALKEIPGLTKKEFLMAGLAFYLAEGSKKTGWIDFINSDPLIISFMYKWLSTFFDVTWSDCYLSIFINQVHRSRERKIRKFWVSYLNMPISRFKSFVWLKNPQKKLYENHDNYFGTARLKVLKSRSLFYKIQGLMNAMIKAEIMPA